MPCVPNFDRFHNYSLLTFLFKASIRKDLLPTCVTPAAADAVLIFWDSDISDVNEDILSASAKYALRETYRTNLLGTLDTIKKSGRSSFFKTVDCCLVLS